MEDEKFETIFDVDKRINDALEGKEQHFPAQASEEMPTSPPLEEEAINNLSTVEDSESEERPLVRQRLKANEVENMRNLREKAERAERERDELKRALQDAQNKSSDEEMALAPDDFAEGKHLSRVQKQIRNLQNELNEYKQQSHISIAEARIKAKHPDFDSVVSRENIEVLSSLYPELAQTLMQSNDLYTQGVSAYTLIKKLGIQKSLNYEVDKQQAQRNSFKPKPLASVSPQQGEGGALSKANAFAGGLTEELKQQLYKEMKLASKANY